MPEASACLGVSHRGLWAPSLQAPASEAPARPSGATLRRLSLGEAADFFEAVRQRPTPRALTALREAQRLAGAGCGLGGVGVALCIGNGLEPGAHHQRMLVGGSLACAASAILGAALARRLVRSGLADRDLQAQLPRLRVLRPQLDTSFFERSREARALKVFAATLDDFFGLAPGVPDDAAQRALWSPWPMFAATVAGAVAGACVGPAVVPPWLRSHGLLAFETCAGDLGACTAQGTAGGALVPSAVLLVARVLRRQGRWPRLRRRLAAGTIAESGRWRAWWRRARASLGRLWATLRRAVSRPAAAAGRRPGAAAPH